VKNSRLSKGILTLLILATLLLLVGCTEGEPGWGNVRFIDETGTAFGVERIDNKPNVASTPEGWEIARRNISGAVGHRAVGHNGGVGASLEDLCEQGGIVNLPLSTTAMQIDGSHANDTGVVIYTSTATGGSTTTLQDTGQDFTAGSIVAVGDTILLDDDVEWGTVAAVAATELTANSTFTGNIIVANGDNYRIVDKSAGGTGVQVVEVEGLTGDYIEQREFVITNGLGIRTLSKSFLRVNSFHTMFAGARVVGTDLVASGTILLEDQATGTVTYGQITVNSNMMLQAIRTVPSGKIMYIYDFSGASVGGKDAEILLRATADYHDRHLLPDIFIFQDIIHTQDADSHHVYDIPFRIPAKADVKISAIGSGAGTNIIASFGYWLEDE